MERHRAGRSIFGLPRSFSGLRWTSRAGGVDDLALAHGNPRPDPEPLIVVGVMLVRYDDGSRVDIHNTLGTILMLEERSRNDPAFQPGTRDQTVIERELQAVPGPEAWRDTEIEVDGRLLRFKRLDRGEDWIAVHDRGDERLYVHSQQGTSQPIAVETITEVDAYLDGKQRIAELP